MGVLHQDGEEVGRENLPPSSFKPAARERMKMEAASGRVAGMTRRLSLIEACLTHAPTLRIGVAYTVVERNRLMPDHTFQSEDPRLVKRLTVMRLPANYRLSMIFSHGHPKLIEMRDDTRRAKTQEG